MTELEAMKKAKACLEHLAKGIDPLTGTAIPEGETVRKPVVIKCLELSAKHLQEQILAEEDSIDRFVVSRERAEKFRAVEEAITITRIARTINEGVEPEENGFISSSAILCWLETKGLLERYDKDDGSRFARKATEKAVEYGITNTYAQNGNHKGVIYNSQAQQWIYDSIEEISEFCVQNKELFPRPQKVDFSKIKKD